MTPAKYSFLLLTITGSVFAQQFSHPLISPATSGSGRDVLFPAPRPFITTSDTVNVLAVMIQFQEDNDARTSGNGRFVVSSPIDSIIDAPPRNRRYFQDHLKFLENYFRKVSKGKTIVRSTVVDSVFTLSTVMGTYSPPRSGSNSAVGNLARDTWQKVDSSGLVPNFAAYDCFVVFHAGIGRDIDLVAVLGFDPTPLDIPSLFLGLNAFREFYGSGYQGIPVNGGSFHITNSIIIPETETRVLPGVGGDVTLELSINGLLCASLGNFLGLPDLFDTNTGRSGIGRFGLMDGQAIFSFAGVFPPEPSAWEKYWLGWIQPITLPAGSHTVSLPAVSLADTVYRVPISSGEYFLVENRTRDPLGNGQTIFSTYNGVTRQQAFPRDVERFNAFNISALAGVVTDVEDFDWSLPGGVDQNGGTLIWHIDESVIVQGLGTNSVNANPNRRGVDVEEADGSQDIGQQYGIISPGAGSEEGTALDFWYAGNASPIFKNEFSSSTFPNSSSNGGANSHITISGFDARGPRMHATIKVGDANVSLLNGFPKSTNEILPPHALTMASVGNSQPGFFVSTSGVGIPPPRAGSLGYRAPAKVFSWASDGSALLSGGFRNGLTTTATGTTPFVSGPSIKDFDGDGIAEIALGQQRHNTAAAKLRVLTFHDQSPVDSLADDLFAVNRPGSLGGTPPVIAESLLAFGSEKGKVYFVDFVGQVVDSLQNSPDTTVGIAGISRFVDQNAFIVTGFDGIVRITSRSIAGGTTRSDVIRSIGRRIVGPAVTGLFNGAIRIAFATTDGWLYLTDGSLNSVPGFPVNTGAEVKQSPALADCNGDGLRDIVLFSGFRIHVYNVAGASLDYFPITVRSSGPLMSAPIVADVDSDADVDIVAVSEDGIVVAYDRNGTMARGFPLQAGIGDQSAASFVYTPVGSQITQIGLVVASSEDGSVSGWWTGTSGPVAQILRGSTWLQYQHDAQHSGLAVEPVTGTPLSSDFFPQNRAYNWPNPVYDGKTFIRYFVNENATVSVKVFDLAGDLVKEFPGPGIGGVDNEVEWNVAGVQSGIYFARIEANGSGKNGIAVVKVAVVK